MREQLATFRAAFTVYRRRRGAFVLLIVLVAMMGVTVWVSYSIVREQRRTLAQVERGNFELANVGFECDPTACRMAMPNGRAFGPTFPASILQGSNGNPPDPQEIQRILASYKPQIEAAFHEYITAVDGEFSPRRILVQRARSLGSLWGIIFVTLLGATLFGAEWRWGVWRTLLTHEPRRARLLLGKLAALWSLVAIAFVITLGLVSAADAIFRSVYSVGAGGGRSIGIVLLAGGRALLGLEFFATLAAMFAMLFRSSLAGLGGPLAFALLDGLATRHFLFLRHYLPAQQVATLLPRGGVNVTVAAPWWSLITGTVKCGPLGGTGPSGPGPFGGTCRFIAFRPVTASHAAIVLGLWVVAAAFGAYAVLRARDVPQ